MSSSSWCDDIWETEAEACDLDLTEEADAAALSAENLEHWDDLHAAHSGPVGVKAIRHRMRATAWRKEQAERETDRLFLKMVAEYGEAWDDSTDLVTRGGAR